MNFTKLNSWAKVNLSLNVIKRLPNKYHQIESLLTFIQLSDEIKIRKINKPKNKVFFSGKFSKGISNNNTIVRLLNLLEKKKLIKKKNFEIKVTKNIPQKSGMGGGSMNAASVLKYLMKKKIVNISHKKAQEIAYKIGFDVVLGLEKKNSILLKNGNVIRLDNKLNFHVLIVIPRIGCSTRDIFSRVRTFSKPLYFNKNKIFFRTNNLIKLNNDLEKIVYKKYPIIKNLKNFLSNLPNVVFTRMTGTGSAVVAYFKSKNAVKKAEKFFKSKYKSYWYIISKTI